MLGGLGAAAEAFAEGSAGAPEGAPEGAPDVDPEGGVGASGGEVGRGGSGESWGRGGCEGDQRGGRGLRPSGVDAGGLGGAPPGAWN